jgi:hypothetical protein
MPRRSNFVSRFVQNLLGVAVACFGLYLVLPHLAVTVPHRALVSPWVATSALAVAAACFLYWSVRYGRGLGGDMRPLFVTAGAVGMAVAVSALHDAPDVGQLSREMTRGSCVAGLIAIVPCSIADCVLSWKLFPGLFSGREHRKQTSSRAGAERSSAVCQHVTRGRPVRRATAKLACARNARFVFQILWPFHFLEQTRKAATSEGGCCATIHTGAEVPI